MTGGQASSSLRFIHDLFTISCVCVQNLHHLDRILAHYSTYVCHLPSRKIHYWTHVFSDTVHSQCLRAPCQCPIAFTMQSYRREHAPAGECRLIGIYIFIIYQVVLVIHLYHLFFYIPLIFPATLSTAFFNCWDSFTTRSLSSSAHSARNVVVSAT